MEPREYIKYLDREMKTLYIGVVITGLMAFTTWIIMVYQLLNFYTSLMIYTLSLNLMFAIYIRFIVLDELKKFLKVIMKYESKHNIIR